MARKSLILKNNNRKDVILHQKEKRKLLSIAAKDTSLSFEERLRSQIKLAVLPRDGSPVRYRNRCAITGRPRGNYRKFGLSRSVLRDLASWGQIPGLIKSSW